MLRILVRGRPAGVRTGDRDDLLAGLKTAQLDLLYLFCHARGGKADPATKKPKLELMPAAGGKPGPISADALAEEYDWIHHPLVFLNGCNTALFSPDALSPFVRTLVDDCAAAGVVGTEVPVFEELAAEFAKLFLKRFFNGEKAGEALLDVRRELLRRHNPPGLVYTLYASAALKLVAV